MRQDAPKTNENARDPFSNAAHGLMDSPQHRESSDCAKSFQAVGRKGVKVIRMGKVWMVSGCGCQPCFVRHKQDKMTLRLQDPIALGEEIHGGSDMLQRVRAMNRIELRIGKRPWEEVEIMFDESPSKCPDASPVLVRYIHTDGFVAKVG